jgi:enediyne biosynthesis protein E4
LRSRRSNHLRPAGFAAIVAAASFHAQAGPDSPSPGFRDVSAAAGIRVEHGFAGVPGSITQRAQGGVAVGDYDRDGNADVFATTGNARSPALLRNLGDGTFVDVTIEAGLTLTGVNTSGPLFFDYDGDGWLDLLVGATDQDHPLLFRNRRGGNFEDVTLTAGLEELGSTISASAGDYDGDGFLDLFLAHWGEARGTCHLWRNQQGRRFDCVDALVELPSFADGFVDQTFTGNFVDLDADGRPDLLVTSDFGSSRVLRNVSSVAGARFEPWSSPVISDENGMGAAVGDYDGDGFWDWFVTGVWDGDGVTEGAWGTSGNRLYRGLGDGTFEDWTDAAGVREGDWGWAACFADLNQDARLDLVHVNGWPQGSKQFRATPARLFIAASDGTFDERAAELGFTESGGGRGLACFDYDRDGDLDLLVMNNSGPLRLWRNDASEGAYLLVELADRSPNTQGIGATVRIVARGVEQRRLLRAGSNYVSQDEAVAHFGLDQAQRVDELQVSWPDGERTTLHDVAANQRITVQRPATALRPLGGCSAAF